MRFAKLILFFMSLGFVISPQVAISTSSNLCCLCRCQSCSFTEIYKASANGTSMPIGVNDCEQLCVGSCPQVLECGSYVSSTPCDSNTLFSGWWYESSMPGTGISIEFDDENHWFMAWYVYNTNGATLWYTANGEVVDSSKFSGDMFQWTGWPWGEEYQPPSAKRIGSVDGILLQGETKKIVLDWNIDNIGSGTLNLTNFMKDNVAGRSDSRNITGWWYDPSHNGMGFFIEARGGTLFMAWYNYRGDGSAQWLTSTGSFPDGALTYNGSLSSWQNGQTPGGPYRKPQELTSVGSINLTFQSPSRAVAIIDQTTTLNLVRFQLNEHGQESPEKQTCEEMSDKPGMVHCGTITIDGDYDDWAPEYRIYADSDGPDCSDSPGLDLREVYLAQDETYIYLRFVLNGPLAETYGYKFGNSQSHIYVYQQGSEGGIFYANASGLPLPNLPSEFVHIDGNQFECKFYKSDVMPYWKDGEELAAWLDQGFETECRDYVELPGLAFNF